MSRLTWCSTSSRSLPRSYTLLMFRISTSTLMTASLRFLQLDARAIRHVVRRRAHHARAGGEALDQAQITERLPRGDGLLPRAPVVDDEYHALPGARDDRRGRNQHPLQRRGGPACALTRCLLEEGDAHAHVGEDARVLLVDAIRTLTVALLRSAV